MAAREPLGPWQRVGNINPWNEETGCGQPVPTQNNFVATVATAAVHVDTSSWATSGRRRPTAWTRRPAVLGAASL